MELGDGSKRTTRRTDSATAFWVAEHRGLGSGVCLPVTKSRCLGKQKQPSLPPVSNEIRLLGERFPTMKSLGRRGDEEENLLENGERLSQKPQSNTNPAGSPICK